MLSSRILASAKPFIRTDVSPGREKPFIHSASDRVQHEDNSVLVTRIMEGFGPDSSGPE
jgi:hypothetical protein